MRNILIPVVELVTVRMPQMIMKCASMSFCRHNKARKEKPILSLECGFSFLLENGAHLLLEKGGTQVFPPVPPKVFPIFLLETGGQLLQENGLKIQLEHKD